MLYLSYTPRPPLSDFIEGFWLYEGDSPTHAFERKLPNGAMELIINLREDALRVYDAHDHRRYERFPGMVICGAYSESFVIDTACQSSLMGVCFKPGGAFPFFNLPAAELRDTHVSLDTFWKSNAGDLRCRLLEAPTSQAKFHVLERCLLAQMLRPFERHRAVAFALQEFQNAPYASSVSGVVERTGLSARRFIEVFSEQVGLTPKVFLRIQRFQHVLRDIDQHREWADLALACGYFDQSHFIHDFRAFSGINPTTYLTRRGAHHNHVPLEGSNLYNTGQTFLD